MPANGQQRLLRCYHYWKERQGARTDIHPNLGGSSFGQATKNVAQLTGASHGYVPEANAS
ncbi:MAG TPA: hypothetical protein VGK01_26110 [Candidatus Angelobacter sp.]